MKEGRLVNKGLAGHVRGWVNGRVGSTGKESKVDAEARYIIIMVRTKLAKERIFKLIHAVKGRLEFK